MGWAEHVPCLEDKGCAYRVSVGKSEGKRPLGSLVVDGRIILKWMCKKLDGEARTWIDLA
jgi:hypothetical protein